MTDKERFDILFGVTKDLANALEIMILTTDDLDDEMPTVRRLAQKSLQNFKELK